MSDCSSIGAGILVMVAAVLTSAYAATAECFGDVVRFGRPRGFLEDDGHTDTANVVLKRVP